MIIKKQEKKIKLSLSKNKIDKKDHIIKKLSVKKRAEKKEISENDKKIVVPKLIQKRKTVVSKKKIDIKQDLINIQDEVIKEQPKKELYSEQREKQGSARSAGSYSEQSEKQGSARSAGSYCEKSEQQGSARSAGSYIEAIGRRKTSRARVRIFQKGKGIFLINNRSFEEYYPNFYHRKTLETVIKMTKNITDNLDITVIVKGGGSHSQIEAIRHGIAKILTKMSDETKEKLKKLGYLTRDARMRERKKPGLKRARKATQWRKR